jgi:hypothetical protein
MGFVFKNSVDPCNLDIFCIRSDIDFELYDELSTGYICTTTRCFYTFSPGGLPVSATDVRSVAPGLTGGPKSISPAPGTFPTRVASNWVGLLTTMFATYMETCSRVWYWESERCVLTVTNWLSVAISDGEGLLLESVACWKEVCCWILNRLLLPYVSRYPK